MLQLYSTLKFTTGFKTRCYVVKRDSWRTNNVFGLCLYEIRMCVSICVCAVYVDLMTVLMGFSNNKTKGGKVKRDGLFIAEQ